MEKSGDYNPVSGNMPDDFDRILSDLLSSGQQLVTHTKPVQVRWTGTLGMGGTYSFSVQTFRQPGEIIDEGTEGGPVKRKATRFTVALEIGKGKELHRHILPDEVLDIIIRHRDQLNQAAATKSAKDAAARRKAAGYVPTFGGKRGKKKGRK